MEHIYQKSFLWKSTWFKPPKIKQTRRQATWKICCLQNMAIFSSLQAETRESAVRGVLARELFCFTNRRLTCWHACSSVYCCCCCIFSPHYWWTSDGVLPRKPFLTAKCGECCSAGSRPSEFSGKSHICTMVMALIQSRLIWSGHCHQCCYTKWS